MLPLYIYFRSWTFKDFPWLFSLQKNPQSKGSFKFSKTNWNFSTPAGRKVNHTIVGSQGWWFLRWPHVHRLWHVSMDGARHFWPNCSLWFWPELLGQCPCPCWEKLFDGSFVCCFLVVVCVVVVVLFYCCCFSYRFIFSCCVYGIFWSFRLFHRMFKFSWIPGKASC